MVANIRLTLLAMLAILVIGGQALFVLVVFSFDGYVETSANAISIISLVYFSILLIGALTNKKFLFFLLPVVAITVPNAINDLIPSNIMGPIWETNSSDFAFFTHIDIFCLAVLFKYQSQAKIRHIHLPLILLIGIITYYIFHIAAYADNTTLLGGFLIGLYQIRYFVYCIFLASLFQETKYFKYLFLGICLSAMLLVTESLITTILRGGGLIDRLGSGNFGTNVYGNFLAGLVLLIGTGAKLLVQTRKYRLLCYSLCAILICALWLTGTRSALAAAITSQIIIFMMLSQGSKAKKTLTTAACVVALGVFLFFAYTYGARLAETGVFSGNYSYDGDASSINTRLVLWGITLRMVADHYVFGVGNLVWNFLKYDYGSPFAVLLDPHSDYLNYLVSYGPLLGIGLIAYLYIYPLSRVSELRRAFYRGNYSAKCYFVFLSAMLPILISSFSNSNTAKHQVFFIFCFFSLCCIKLCRGDSRPTD